MKLLSLPALLLAFAQIAAAADDPFLKATNTAPESQFGRAVAVSGYTLAVGAPKENSIATASGAVYVYVRDLSNPASWRLEAFIKAPNPDVSDGFGSSVALSGNTLIIGAPTEDGNGSSQADNTAMSSGAAYIYQRIANTWVFQAYLKASNLGDFDLFGQSVAIDGNTAVVGAYGEDGPTNAESASGAVYVFVRSGSRWIQQAYLKTTTSTAGDFLGLSVALSGNTIAAGAPYDDAGVADSGAAFVFVRNGKTWTEQARLKASSPVNSELFGWSVTVSGDSVVAGARNATSSGQAGAGAAYVFSRSGTSWAQEARLTASTPIPTGRFGTAVSLWGDKLIVGAPADTAGTGNAEVFQRRGTLWAWQQTLTHLDPDVGDAIGNAVAIEENWMLAGGDGDDASGTWGPNVEEYNNSASNAGCALLYPSGPKLESLSKSRLPAPGTTDINYGTPLATAISPSGYALFSSQLTGRGAAKGGNSAVFAADDEGTDLVVQSGTLTAGAKLSAITGLSANHATAGAVFQGSAGKARLIFVDYGTHVTPVFQTGNPLGSLGTPDKFLDLTQAHTLDRLGLVYHLAGAPTDSDTGLALTNHNGVIIVSTLKEGANAPGGGVFGEFVRSTFTGSFFSCIAKWVPGAGQAPKDALFRLSSRDNPLQGDLAGGTSKGERFGTFTSLTRRGSEAVLRATLTGSSAATNEGVWTQAGALLIRKGDDIGGGIKIAKLIRVWATDSNQLVAHVVLTGPGVTSATNQALLCKPSTTNVVQVLARTGQTCPGKAAACRLRTLSAIDVDPISGRYAILATLSGVPTARAQAVLAGQTTLGNDTNQVGLRLPRIVLERGQWFNTPTTLADSIASIAMRPVLDPSGTGGRGLGQVIASDGSLVLIITGKSRQSEVVRLTID
ncbi:MAG: FG-GAP repeat protein [Verrucomicrobiales bacterium]|nr:FG-GAP repeat protein [Verrucomicrobiales bacterium]MCP5560576.1 FG-GAP repeat protein [Verrucomicrobiaceae bacterium]